MTQPLTPPAHRVVVTGIGMMTPVGIGREQSWSAMLAGENGIGPVTLCDASDLESRVAGEVMGFDPLDYIERKEARRMDRFTHLAIAASAEALEHAGLDVAVAADEIGVMIGCGHRRHRDAGGAVPRPVRAGTGARVAVPDPGVHSRHGQRAGFHPLRRARARTTTPSPPAPPAQTPWAPPWRRSGAATPWP